MSLRRIVAIDAGGPLQRRVVDGPGVRLVHHLLGKMLVEGGQAEIHQLRLAGAVHQHVAHLQIAMRQAELEGVPQGLGDVHCQPGGLQGVDLSSQADQLPETPAFDELHDQIRRLGVGHDVEGLHDVGMAERQADAALAQEHGGLGLLVAEPLAQCLDGHDLTRLAVRARNTRETCRRRPRTAPCTAHRNNPSSRPRQAIDLVTGQIVAADEHLHEIVERHLALAQPQPDLVQLLIAQQSRAQRPARQVVLRCLEPFPLPPIRCHGAFSRCLTHPYRSGRTSGRRYGCIRQYRTTLIVPNGEAP